MEQGPRLPESRERLDDVFDCNSEIHLLLSYLPSFEAQD